MELKSFFNRVYVELFKSNVVFSLKTRMIMLGYIILLAIFSVLTYLLCENNCNVFGLTFLTGGLIMLPFFLYFGLSIYVYVSKKIKGESTKDKRPLKVKFENYLQWLVFVILYGWVCLLLILAMAGLIF